MRAKRCVSLEVTVLTVGRKIVLVLWSKDNVLFAPMLLERLLLGFPLQCLHKKKQVSFILRYGCALLYRLKVMESVGDLRYCQHYRVCERATFPWLV